MTVQGTDRYEALDIDPSDCSGQCEGTGFVPVFVAVKTPGPSEALIDDETNAVLRALWKKAEATQPTKDGWHFVACPECQIEARELGVA